MIQLVLILDNLRSAANVGSILRTADATGVERVIACGITPYPALSGDTRDPVVAGRNSRAIARTALGAEHTVAIEYMSDTRHAIARCRADGRTTYALECTADAANILRARLRRPAALVVGSETDGLNDAALAVCDETLVIPQTGHKESLNVAVATGVALYQFFAAG